MTDVVKDGLSLLTDEAQSFFGISARPLRNIVATLEALDGIPAAGVQGDIAADLGGTLEVITGEHDGDQVAAGEKLVGWVVRVENWWEFVPCIPQKWWSTAQSGWVDHETICTENRAKWAEPGSST